MFLIAVAVLETATATAQITGLTCGLLGVACSPAPNFTASCSALACRFTNTTQSSGQTLTSNWDFGDGSSSSEPSPSHSYERYSSYDVTLTENGISTTKELILQKPLVKTTKTPPRTSVLPIYITVPLRPVARPAAVRPAPATPAEPKADHRTAGVKWDAPVAEPFASSRTIPVAQAIALVALALVILLLEIRRSLARLRESRQFTRDIISNVSHEWRTPLTAIKGYATMIGTRRVPTPRAQQFAREIVEASDRLERVIDVLLRVSEMDAGRPRRHPEPFDAQHVVAEAVARWSERAPGRTFVVEHGREAVATGDPHLIAVALDQLIDNAVKFSTGPIVVGARRDEHGVAVRVTDRGPGIERDDQQRIFGDFVQLDPSSTRDAGGLGLGLALVRRVAEAHGGQIEVASDPGHGSTFTIRLPEQKPASKHALAAALFG